MVESKQLKLFRLLVDKTLKDELDWERTIDEGVYQVPLAGYVIQVRAVSSEHGGPDEADYVVKVIDQNGIVMDSFSDAEVASDITNNDRTQFYRSVSEMFNRVRRRAIGADQAIDSILEELSRPA